MNSLYLFKLKKQLIKQKKVNVEKALVMRLINGMSYSDIAKYFDVSHQAINQALKPFIEALEDTNAIKAFEQNESNLINAAKMKIFSHLVANETLKKASLNNLAYAYDRLNVVKRLEEDKSTANIAYADVTKSLKDDIEALKQQGLDPTQFVTKEDLKSVGIEIGNDNKDLE